MTDPSSSPAASTILGTATNPNTPPPDDAQSGSIVPGQAMDDAASSSADSPGQRGQDIQPTWPSEIDRANIRAYVFWQREQHMDNILLDLHWAGQHNHAFFNLHTRLRLEGAPGASRRGLINAYIFIYPERIRRLSFTAQPQYSPFGSATIALTFQLSRRPALVLPEAYTSLGQGAEEAMRSLRSLIQQLNFTVYASLPSRRLSPTWLQQFCNDVTEQRFTTIASLANLNTLYQGQGTQVIEGDDLLETVDSRDNSPAAQELPAYQKTNQSIPLTRSDMTTMQALLENRLESMLAAHERRLGEMLSAHEHKVNEMLSAHRCKIDVEEKIESMEERVKCDVMDQLTDAMNERMREELDGVQEEAFREPEPAISFGTAHASEVTTPLKMAFCKFRHLEPPDGFAAKRAT
ncbi:uncharacterized protein Triagg1_7264 [Trichoderma aggressivum f. europaeum]|uniref:Uncharacterized protein n=1 Tax=Trichoderma aggressivum f. europaeum TaxID=173218 RepID=A0AAE1J2T3_9HYPO|nr:hypothetical protein Triagg1_7264 [Trichoderma aggressivum f. europaeum]